MPLRPLQLREAPCNATNSTADRNINPNPAFGVAESLPPAHQKGGVRNNYRNSEFWQVLLSQDLGRHSGEPGRPESAARAELPVRYGEEAA